MKRPVLPFIRLFASFAMVLILACIFFFSFMPGPKIKELCPGDFNLSCFFRLYPFLHFIAYMTLTSCLFILIDRDSAARFPVAFLFPFILGGLIEIFQRACHILTHTMSLGDFTLNMVGIFTAAGLVFLIEKKIVGNYRKL